MFPQLFCSGNTFLLLPSDRHREAYATDKQPHPLKQSPTSLETIIHIPRIGLSKAMRHFRADRTIRKTKPYGKPDHTFRKARPHHSETQTTPFGKPDRTIRKLRLHHSETQTTPFRNSDYTFRKARPHHTETQTTPFGNSDYTFRKARLKYGQECRSK